MRPSRISCAFTCCALMLAAMRAPAEEALPAKPGTSQDAASLLRVGQRVRLNESERKMKTLVGRVVGLDDRTLLLEIRAGADPLPVRRSDIHSVEVPTGRSHRHVGKGLLVGSLWTLAAYVALGSESSLAFIAWPQAVAFFTCSLLCAVLIGPAIGAAIGGMTVTEEWRPLSVGRVALQVVPTRHGAAASLSFGF